MKIYYLYRHIRLDINQVFYIGIGSGITYKRAFSKSKRNKFWHNVVNKTEYRVEILLESDDKSLITSKEMEFIKLYGRRDKNEGTLVNLTDGGDYNGGRIISQEHREKIAKANTGKKRTEEQKINHSNKMRGRVTSAETKLKLSIKGKGRKMPLDHKVRLIELNTGRIVSNETKLKISESLTGNKQSEETKLKRAISLQKQIIQKDMTGSTIEIYESAKKIKEKYPSFNLNNIRECCRGEKPKYKNFIWQYL